MAPYGACKKNPCNIWVILGSYRDNGKYNGNYDILGSYRDNGKYNGNYYILGSYRDNGKENGNYYTIMGYISGIVHRSSISRKESCTV